jgi:FMN phosphatase YigB (HAD superfamily)
VQGNPDSADRPAADLKRPGAGLTAYLNQQNSLKKNSPLEPFAQWFLPRAKKQRASIRAVIKRADTIRGLQEIPALCSDQNIVSIDFFDTLVTRPVEPPEFVLGKVAEISASLINRQCGYVVTEAGYLRGRSNCEAALRRENLKINGADSETSLPAVLERLLRQIGVFDESLLKRLLEAEIALESDALSLNAGAQELLAVLKSEKKTILVLSDMYLTSELLSKIAGRLGIAEYIDRWYVSGEVGLAKSSGRLYTHVLKDNGISSEDMIHFGDNYQSDYQMPSSLGIESRWLYQPEQLGRRHRIEGRLRRKPAHFIGKLTKARAEQLYPRSDMLERTLFTHFAPAVFCMAYRSLNACLSLGIVNVYFLAREGISLKPVFERLLEEHAEFQGHDIRLRTLYCSRASTMCGRFDKPDDLMQLTRAVAGRKNDLVYDYRLEEFLSAWNIVPDRIGAGEDRHARFRSAEELAEFFSARPHLRTAMAERLQDDRRLLSAYMRREGVFKEACAFVDVGWGGTIQANIEALEPEAEIYGMYLGTDEKFEARNLRGQIFSSSDYRTGAVCKAAPLTETLLSVSGLGTTTSYEVKDEQVSPVFSAGGELSQSMESVRKRVLSDYYPLFESLSRAYCIPAPVLLEHARSQYFKLATHPTRGLLRSLDELKYKFDWGEEGLNPLLARISAADLLRPRRTLSRLWNAPWLFGSLKANYLGLFNRPISWVLGHEELINRQKLMRLKRSLGSGN